MKKGNIAALCVSIVLMIAFLLTSCGKKNSISTMKNGDDNKPITFTMFLSSSNLGKAPAKDNPILKKITEKTGVTFDYQFMEGDSERRYGIMISSGDYPDILSGFDRTRFLEAKALIPLEDLINSYGPNLKKLIGRNWNKLKDSKDGHIYTLPVYGLIHGKYVGGNYTGGAFWVQKDVLAEAGYPKIKTLDQYFELIKQYKEKHPIIDGKPTLGFEILSFDWRNFCLKNPPEYLSGHPNDGGVVVDNNAAQQFADKEISKRYYKKLNEAYQEGLINGDTFVENYDQYLSNIASGRVLGMYDQHWQFSRGELALRDQHKDSKTYVPLPIVFDGSITDRYRDEPPLNGDVGITVKCKDPVKVIKFLDSLLDEETQKLLLWGQKDIDYKLDDKGVMYRTPDQREEQKDPNYRAERSGFMLIDSFPHYDRGTFDDGNACDINNQPGEYRASLSDYDKAFLEHYKVKNFEDMLTPAKPNETYYPCYSMNIVKNSPADAANTQMNNVQMKYLPKLIMCKSSEFDSIWNEYAAAIQKCNPKAYEDAINKEIQWRLNNWK